MNSLNEKTKKTFKSAFTLLEVTVGLLIVSIMLAVLAPVLTVSMQNDKKENVVAKTTIIDTTPVGVICAWYGVNYPEGWLPLNGQPIEEQYADLKQALGGIENLPDLNNGHDPNEGTTWIIKAVKK